MPKKDTRSRIFAFIVYPDSINTPDNWLDILREFHIPCFVSPLHKDGYDPEGLGKKPHHHIMLVFEGNKSDEQISEIKDPVGGVGICKVKSKVGYARYLCHLDEDDKIKYNVSDVIQYGGLDYLTFIESESDIDLCFCEIEDFIDKHNVFSFYALSRYCSKYRKDWARLLRHSGAVYFREYLKSRKWSEEHDEMIIIDYETGEVL